MIITITTADFPHPPVVLHIFSFIFKFLFEFTERWIKDILWNWIWMRKIPPLQTLKPNGVTEIETKLGFCLWFTTENNKNASFFWQLIWSSRSPSNFYDQPDFIWVLKFEREMVFNCVLWKMRNTQNGWNGITSLRRLCIQLQQSPACSQPYFISSSPIPRITLKQILYV